MCAPDASLFRAASVLSSPFSQRIPKRAHACAHARSSAPLCHARPLSPCSQEIAGYDGWGHDQGRVWRTGDVLQSEGFDSFKSKFGPEAFTLHHRFYLHLDRANRFWLSAEDGCEGVAPVLLK